MQKDVVPFFSPSVSQPKLDSPCISLLQDDVDKDLLSQELEQATSKLNWYNEKFKDYADLQTKFDSVSSEKEQLESDLQIQQQTIVQLRLEIEQFNALEQSRFPFSFGRFVSNGGAGSSV